jgi:HEPN domain-containing protein
MPRDPVRVADTRAWLAKALLDLRSARVDLDAAPPIVGDALFHCQQAVEKTLKALLCWHDQPFRKSHDLGELGARCVELEAGLEPLLRQAAPLTEYAWKYRYPGDALEPEPPVAVEALRLAESVVGAITAALPQEARPSS